MCGIAGIISKSKGINPKDLNRFKSGVELMKHRGPDFSGEYVTEDVALFHQRLSILDLDKRSNQPFFSSDENFITIYNGEVYNFKELANNENFNLNTTSDTEVLIELFQKYQERTFIDWNGIFAFAAYDKKRRKLTIVRDRFGVKPLYYFENDKYFMFASEAKVIYHWMEELKISYQALGEFLAQGNSIGESTLVEGVKKLTPGHYLSLNLQNFEFSDNNYIPNLQTEKLNLSFDEIVKETRNKIEKAVQRQMVSDVPLGIFLSGGIDSSAITAFSARNSTEKISTYSVEFDFNRGGNSELEKAKMIAKKYNTSHHELKVDSRSIINIFEDLVFQHDEPFSDAANIPLFLLTEAVKGDLTVVLQGDGGDELFAGYGRYELLDNPYKWKALTFGASILNPNPIGKARGKRIYDALSQKEDYMKLASLTTSFKRDEDFGLFNKPIRKGLNSVRIFQQYQKVEALIRKEPLVQRMLYTDMKIELPNTYLEKVDKSTMANSIEARVPFLDNDLVSFVSALPSRYKVKNGEKKFLLKQALRSVVPDEILDAPKRGFNVPREIWLRETMKSYCKDKLTGDMGRLLLDQQKLEIVLKEHGNLQVDKSHSIWKILVLVCWFERYRDKIDFNDLLGM